MHATDLTMFSLINCSSNYTTDRTFRTSHTVTKAAGKPRRMQKCGTQIKRWLQLRFNGRSTESKTVAMKDATAAADDNFIHPLIMK